MQASGRGLILAAAVTLAFATQLSAADPSQGRARELWELAIEAKGGRERLHNVRNVVLSSTSYYRVWLKRIPTSYESLLVLPSKLWHWSDERPTVFGLTLEITDLDRDHFQMVHHGYAPLPPGKAAIRCVREIRELQVLTLLETKWTQPSIVRARNVAGALRSAPVVEARIAEQTFEFQLDRKTHLPTRVVVRTPTENGTHLREYRLSDYREIAGLQLPHEVYRASDGLFPAFRQKVAYEINVDFDEEIFLNPPSLDAGAKGWQRRVARE